VQLAAAVERSSEHPLGQAVVEDAGRRELPMLSASEFENRPGRGVVGTV